MALLGKAAMILTFDIVPEAIAEHDHWHSFEHLPDRLSIPGFLRGSRWTAPSDSAHYLVMYEVNDLNTLTSPAYLERLNNPTPWTSQMMKHYRGMSRGFCRTVFSTGAGLGNGGLLIRLSPDPHNGDLLRDWLVKEALPSLPDKPGVVSAHLFEAALTPEITKEQRIRGKDGEIDWVLLVTGHDEKTIAKLAEAELALGKIEHHGATNLITGQYRMVHSLLSQEISTI